MSYSLASSDPSTTILPALVTSTQQALSHTWYSRVVANQLGVDHQGSPQNVAGPSHVLPRDPKIGTRPGETEKTSRRNTELSTTRHDTTRQQHHNHGFFPRGSPRLPRRCLTRLFPGLHLTMAICLHPTRSTAKRRNLYLQHTGGSAPHLLHPDLLHGPRQDSSRLAREYCDQR